MVHFKVWGVLHGKLAFSTHSMQNVECRSNGQGLRQRWVPTETGKTMNRWEGIGWLGLVIVQCEWRLSCLVRTNIRCVTNDRSFWSWEHIITTYSASSPVEDAASRTQANQNAEPCPTLKTTKDAYNGHVRVRTAARSNGIQWIPPSVASWPSTVRVKNLWDALEQQTQSMD